MIDNCLLRLLPLLRVLLGLQRGRDEALTVHFHRDRMDELPFKIVRMQGSQDEVIARVENFLICKAAFEKALFVYPNAHLEMRQGARIILKSKEEPRC
jgi:hypothetical protein